jgi:hypothetical protein
VLFSLQYKRFSSPGKCRSRGLGEFLVVGLGRILGFGWLPSNGLG